MEDAGETVGENPLPTKVHGFPIDLVPVKLEENIFVDHDNYNARLEGDGVIELSLGLSLNGKFGIDPKRTQVKEFRASTMSTFTLNSEENQPHQEVQSGVHDEPPIIRTCSLPSVMMEEESRKRRQLQLLKRVEAKKRRMDKLRFSKEERENHDNNGFVCNNGEGAMRPTLLQGSELVSQGSGSSGISELESISIPDSLTNDAKALDPHNIHYRTVSGKEKQVLSVVAEEKARKKKMDDGFRKKMPFVSTIGKGPNGKRIEGFLYQYKKGEEVKIVCVCHGSAFSPPEFVRHAGGVEVENPLRHIVVTSPPCL